MQFRDMRHQLEADDDKLKLWLETSRARFYSNLSLLQLQVPELAQQLRSHTFEQAILTCDKAGDGNLLNSQTLQMHWPPRLLRHSYTVLEGEFSLLATRLEDDGQSLIAALLNSQAHSVLVYVESLDMLCASFHCTDWTPLLKHSQLFFQVGVDIAHIEADRQLLQQHGIQVNPFALLNPEAKSENIEYGWHFEQALQFTHACDPVLRPHTHKFKKQHEFVFLNALIEDVSQAPLPLTEIRNLLLCGAHPGVLEKALNLPKLERIVYLHDTEPFPQDTRFRQQGIEVIECVAPLSELPDQLLACMHQLPPEVPWQLRIFQGEDSASARQIRMMTELELRYMVQPAMGLQRSLQTMFHAVVKPQAFLTRRTQWPQVQGDKVPALVLGNGPSLTKTIASIKAGEAKGYLLVSCGSTLTTLLNHDIAPDIHLELELSAWHINQVDSERLKNTLLIAPIGFNHRQRERFSRAASFILNGHSVDELLPGLPADTLRIEEAFPTVLNLAIPLLSELGAKEIWLSGVDFAFSNVHEHHAKGSHYDQQESPRFAEQSGELIPVTGLRGRPLLTKREFQLAAFQAHNAIHKHADVRIMQLSEGLDFGGEYQEKLQPRTTELAEPVFQNCSVAQLGWRKLPVQLDPSLPFQSWLNASSKPTRAALREVLLQPHFQARVQRMTHQPIPLWAESLQRNLAALLLHWTAQQRLNDTSFTQFQQQLRQVLAALAPLVAKLSQ